MTHIFVTPWLLRADPFESSVSGVVERNEIEPERDHNLTKLQPIRNEPRVNDEGEPEVWTNLDDVLDWLQSLSEQTHDRIAANAALQIRQMLLDQFTPDMEHEYLHLLNPLCRPGGNRDSHIRELQ